MRNYVNKENKIFCVLFMGFVLWQVAGIFPAISYEGDALSVCAGCEYTYSHGWHTLGMKGYGYWMQPLTYVALVGLRYLLPALDCEQIYGILSSLSALALQLLVIQFVSKVAGVKRVIALLALALIPESYALAMYPNSMSIAAMLYMAGVLLFMNRKLWPALVVLTAAPLFRLDILVAYPFIIFLMNRAGFTIKKSVILSASYAIVLLGFLYISCRLLRADMFFTMAEYSKWSGIITLKKNLLAIFAFYGIPAIVLLAGSIFIIWRKKISAALLPIMSASWGMILLVHLVECKFGNAAKHFVPAMPFAAVVIALAVRCIWDGKMVMKVALAVGILLMECFGVQMDSEKRQVSQTALNRYVPARKLVSFRNSSGEYALVAGGGQAAMTADEAVLTSGDIVYPFFIHSLKLNDLQKRESFVKYMENTGGKMSVCIVTWEESALLQMLAEEGKFDMSLAAGDSVLSGYVTKIEYPSVRNELIEYVKDKYCTKEKPTIFFQTQSVSHRWEMTLRELERRGLIIPVGDAGSVYIAKRVCSFSSGTQIPICEKP